VIRDLKSLPLIVLPSIEHSGLSTNCCICDLDAWFKNFQCRSWTYRQII